MEYGIDIAQFRARILDPVLVGLQLYSPAASNLMLGTALKESHLEFVAQIRGPAIGLYQMEPATFNDIRANFLAYQPLLKARVDDYAIGTPDAEEMAGNMYFATAMTRAHYRRVKEPLPDANNFAALAAYWKKYYNTVAGKGDAVEAARHFKVAVEST